MLPFHHVKRKSRCGVKKADHADKISSFFLTRSLTAMPFTVRLFLGSFFKSCTRLMSSLTTSSFSAEPSFKWIPGKVSEVWKFESWKERFLWWRKKNLCQFLSTCNQKTRDSEKTVGKSWASNKIYSNLRVLTMREDYFFSIVLV